ncbi:MAG: CDP-glucose 4,6-dehydratase [Brevundimonas sp.]
MTGAGALNPDVWRGRRVLVTGHTGFKGSWLCLMLHRLGAEVIGASLAPESGPTAFDSLGVGALLAQDERLDIRDADRLQALIRATQPEIVLHLAAQALVGRGYRDPAGTFATNVSGAVNLMQALRGLPGVLALLVVTSDKVYRNDGAGRPFVEQAALGGADPYSASKAATEIAVASWRASFASELPPLATARAGNVIGGGDFGEERLIPDLVRALKAGEGLTLRQPEATRPFQHVLDVLRGYLMLTERLITKPATAPAALNFGPADSEISVRRLLDLWGAATGRPVDWRLSPEPPMNEAKRLALDSSEASRTLGWAPLLDTPAAIRETAGWYAEWLAGRDMAERSTAAADACLSGRIRALAVEA